jgi:hypothetical protein
MLTFAEMELCEQEQKDPEQVTAAMLDAANEATNKALDRLIEAEFAFRAALRREDEPAKRVAIFSTRSALDLCIQRCCVATVYCNQKRNDILTLLQISLRRTLPGLAG